MSSAKYRHSLPQSSGRLFLSDGGLETTLIFIDGIELPHFAAFVLLDTEGGEATLRRYYASYLAIAQRHGTGMVLEAPTWRANADWGARLGYNRTQLRRINLESIALLAQLRKDWESSTTPLVISGAIGPRGDGYLAGTATAAEAADYHSEQIRDFGDSEADMVAAYTMNSIAEAMGVARAAQRLRMPAAISFTLETDGRLATGETLQAAIEAVDADTQGWPAYYMINCAHPQHFTPALQAGGAWLSRLRGIKANASQLSHAELDAATTLDAGDPDDLARRYVGLTQQWPGLNILGGCCGTDHRHVAALCQAVHESSGIRVVSNDAA